MSIRIHESDPMAEIALALAMGFFSIMVLMMLSMSSNIKSQEYVSPKENANVEVLQSQNDYSNKKTYKKEPEPFIFIYNKGRYFNLDLIEISITSIERGEEIVLAVMPDLSIMETIKAKKQIDSKNIKITTLDKRWIERLKEENQ